MAIIDLFIFLLLFNFTLVSNETRKYIYKSKLNNSTSLVSIYTGLGYLVGYKQEVSYENIVNKTINVFYGVPFAEKPKRFKRTKLIEKFPNQPYEALDFKDHCPIVSKDYYDDKRFSENCLFMNIWTPNLKEYKLPNGTCTKRFNVILFFHDSTSSIYQMSRLKDSNGEARLFYSGELFAALHDTIFVTFNHRQGVFSSFYLENEDAPGNLMFFDQNLAMQWIKKNAMDLCGKNEFSLIGHGLGGNSIVYQLLTDHVKDLKIKSAILQSSTPFYSHRNPVTSNEALINSLIISHNLGCLEFQNDKINDNINYLDDRVTIEFFQKKNGRYFLDENLVVRKLRENLFDFDPQITDVFYLNNDDYIERDVIKLSKFLSKYSVDIDCLQNATVDQILSLNEIHHNENWNLHVPDIEFIDEKTYLGYKLYDNLYVKSNTSLLIGHLFDENGYIGTEFEGEYYMDRFNAPVIGLEDAKNIIKKRAPLFRENLEILDKLANYYTNESSFLLSRGYFQSIKDLTNDFYFHCPSFFTASRLSENSNIFSYMISYRFQKHYKETKNLAGTYDWIYQAYADELNYLFGMPFRIADQFTDLDRKFSLEIIKLFSSFSKEGVMDVLTSGKKWPVSNRKSSKPAYVELNGQFRRERKFEMEERCEGFWRKYLTFYKR